MKDLIWHRTKSSINLFYKGVTIVLSESHPRHAEVDAIINSEKPDFDRLLELIGIEKMQENKRIVEDFLGVKHKPE